MKLYEINKAIAECVDAETGEISDFERLAALQMVFEEKADNIACLYKSLAAEAAAIREEEKKLAARRQAKENAAKRAKEYLAQMLDGQKLETARNRLSWRTSEAVRLTDDGQLPMEYYEITYSPRLSEIKRVLKAGTDVPGAELVQNRSLQIK